MKLSRTLVRRGVVTGLGLGLLPKMPGTWGTLGAFPLVYVFGLAGDWNYMGLTLVMVVIAIWAAHVESVESGRHDSPDIVIDEVVGYLVAMTWLPFEPWVVLTTFCIFRLLDVIKPPPISWLDKKIKGGVGIVADDILAGIFTNILAHWIFQTGLMPW